MVLSWFFLTTPWLKISRGECRSSGMRKSSVASWIVAAVLVGGVGMALAETAAENPTVSDEVTTTIAAQETTTTVATEPTSGDVAEPAADEADGVESEDAEGGAQGEHGALVSAAAQDHSFDEACGNHGAVVSSVARTGELPECAGTAGSTAGATSSKGHKPAKAKHAKKSR